MNRERKSYGLLVGVSRYEKEHGDLPAAGQDVLLMKLALTGGLAVTLVYGLVKDNVYVDRAMMGVRAAVVPIIISALVKLFKSGMKDLFCYAVALAGLALCLFTHINAALIVVMGAAAGLIYMEGKTRHDLS